MLNPLRNWGYLSPLWLGTGVSAACLHCTCLSPCRVPVGAGQPRNSGAVGAPTTKVAPGAIHPIVAGHSNATTAVRPVVPITAPPTHPQLQAASPQLSNCLRYSAQQPGSQPRSAMQMGKCSPCTSCTGRIDGLPLQCSPLECPHSFPSHLTQSLWSLSIGDRVCFLCW